MVYPPLTVGGFQLTVRIRFSSMLATAGDTGSRGRLMDFVL
jgi:hypothetical protein